MGLVSVGSDLGIGGARDRPPGMAASAACCASGAVRRDGLGGGGGRQTAVRNRRARRIDITAGRRSGVYPRDRVLRLATAAVSPCDLACLRLGGQRGPLLRHPLLRPAAADIPLIY